MLRNLPKKIGCRHKCRHIDDADNCVGKRNRHRLSAVTSTSPLTHGIAAARVSLSRSSAVAHSLQLGSILGADKKVGKLHMPTIVSADSRARFVDTSAGLA